MAYNLIEDLIEDLFFDRMHKEVMIGSNEASLRQEGNERHTRGMEIPDSSIQVQQLV